MVVGMDLQQQPQQQQAGNGTEMTSERRNGSGPAKKRKFFVPEGDLVAKARGSVGAPRVFGRKDADPRSRATRQHRLAQNRKAARESRVRKKALVEELQRSLVFFSKANAALRNEHHELTRKILSAHAELSKLGLAIPESSHLGEEPSVKSLTAPSAAVAPGSVAPGSVAPSTTASMGPDTELPQMEPGATMQGKLRVHQRLR